MSAKPEGPRFDLLNTVKDIAEVVVERIESGHGLDWVYDYNLGDLRDACQAALDADPEAAAGSVPADPEMEWVPWWEAPGRRLPEDLLGRIVVAHPSEYAAGGMYVEYDLPERSTTGNPVRRMSDGAIAVLVEPGPVAVPESPETCVACGGTGQDPTALALEGLGAVLPLHCTPCGGTGTKAPSPAVPGPEEPAPDLPRLYIASKSEHAPQWQRLRDGIADRATIVSTWIDESGPGESSDLVDLWERCIGEVTQADALIAVHYPGETWKGAFIEVGAALALGKPVFVVGDPPGSWRHHSGVRCIGRNDEQVVMPAVDAAIAAASEAPTDGPGAEEAGPGSGTEGETP